MDIFALINKLSTPPKSDDMDKISLTVVEGTITAAMGESMRRQILKMAKDKSVKAMVLRINSPGGSAQASEIMCQALIEFKKAGKPLIISMGNVAASGGYYIACPGDVIFAEDLTITGSIGVVGSGFGYHQLMEKLGIERRSYTAGSNKDFLDPFQPEKPAQKARFEAMLGEIHQQFIHQVELGRGTRLSDDSSLFSLSFY